MTQREKEVVSAIQRSLTEQVGSDLFGLWFGAGVRLRTASDTLVVAAADRFKLDRLRRFRGPLAEASRLVLGPGATVQFEVDPALAIKLAEPGLASADSDTGRAPGNGSKPVPGAAVGPGARVARDTVRGAAAERDHEHTPQRGAGQADGSAGFGGFVVGEGNRMSVESARTMLRRLGQASPLYVYGPSGTGKTHLLASIKSAARGGSRVRRVVSLSAEQFTTDFLEALQGRGLPSFRRKCRDVDLLLIDDVQFFRGKRATLSELQHTIDSLHRAGRQLVLAADRPPSELASLGRELTARMSGGLICRLDPPDCATRLAILEQLAARYEVSFPKAVLRLLAEQLPGDARQLAGALNRLEAASLAFQQPISTGLANSVLDDVFRATRPVVRLDDIDRAVCEVFGLDSRTLQSSRKARAVSQPRMLAMFLARKHTRSALSEIGHYFGQRTHSTVISAQKKVGRWMSSQAALQGPHGECSVEDMIRRVELLLGTG